MLRSLVGSEMCIRDRPKGLYTGDVDGNPYPTGTLPELPIAGDRNGKVVKWNGDVLGWEEDAVGEVGLQTLTSDTTISWDVDDGEVADLTLAHNTTLNITNGQNGEIALLRVLQDTTGSRTLAFNAAIERGGRDAPTLRTAAGERDYLMFNKVGATWVYLGVISDA